MGFVGFNEILTTIISKNDEYKYLSDFKNGTI